MVNSVSLCSIKGIEAVLEAHRKEVERLLDSRTLNGAQSAKRLLKYLAECASEGRAEDLKEYTVGVELFGKGPDYDPKSDSSVRVLMSSLRKRLDEYYGTEGANDPVMIELPKGHFRLAFREMGKCGTAAAPSANGLLRWRIACLLLALALAGAVTIILRQRSGAARAQEAEQWSRHLWTPPLKAFWSPYLQSDRPIMVSLGAPLFIGFSRGFFRDPKVNEWRDAEEAGLVRQLKQQWRSPTPEPFYIYTGIGEAMGTIHLAMLFTAWNRELLFRPSNQITWNDIDSHNVIFVGPEKYNRQIIGLPESQDFVIRHARLINLRPRVGEPSTFQDNRTPDASGMQEGYACITRLRGLNGRGQITILAATSTEGSRAAVEYVTRPEFGAELVEKLQRASGAIPSQFQVVIRTRYRSLVPVEISYVTHHVLSDSLPLQHAQDASTGARHESVVPSGALAQSFPEP